MKLLEQTGSLETKTVYTCKTVPGNKRGWELQNYKKKKNVFIWSLIIPHMYIYQLATKQPHICIPSYPKKKFFLGGGIIIIIINFAR